MSDWRGTCAPDALYVRQPGGSSTVSDLRLHTSGAIRSLGGGPCGLRNPQCVDILLEANRSALSKRPDVSDLRSRGQRCAPVSAVVISKNHYSVPGSENLVNPDLESLEGRSNPVENA